MPTVVLLALALSGLGIFIGPVDRVPLWMEVASKVNPVT